MQAGTFTPNGQGWLDLVGVVDLGLERLCGYSMADHMRAELVTTARTGRRRERRRHRRVIALVDRGSQSTSHDYLDFCCAHQLRPSVDGIWIGRSPPNAVAESSWKR